MGSVLASRSAGLKLFSIIGMLILPIMVLSYLMLGETRDDYYFTKKELSGLRVADVLMPITLAGASHDIQKAEREKLIANFKNIDHDLLGPMQVATLKDLLASDEDNSLEILATSAAYLQNVGTESNLILDPYRESYFLANTAFYEIPNLIKSYHSFYANIDEALAFAGIDNKETKEIMMQLGHLDVALQRITTAVTNTIKSSKDPTKYGSSLRMLAGLEQQIKATKYALKNAKPGNETVALMALSFREIDPKSQFKLETAVWVVTTTELRNILTTRLGEISRRYYTLLTVAGMCLIFAAAGAYSMFRSTLKKLDVVESAKLEAEKMSTQLSTMNNDMVDLNRQLSSKMTMLRNAQDELVRKGRMEQLGQLTATIAHELRNPLGAVRTSSFLLERKLKGSGLDTDKQFERINKGIVRCDNIITQLLDYSRTKQISPKTAVFDTWLIGVVEEMAKTLPAAVQIECELGLADFAFDFDASRLERAVINLLNNASEAILGSVGIDGAQAPVNAKIKLITQMKHGFIELSVIDNGPGISIENLNRIREPLYTTKSFGTGLGIPAIEQIAAQHNGELLVESVLGHGANFTIRLPISQTQHHNHEAA